MDNESVNEICGMESCAKGIECGVGGMSKERKTTSKMEGQGEGRCYRGVSRAPVPGRARRKCLGRRRGEGSPAVARDIGERLMNRQTGLLQKI